jgi:hypothetical protein
VCASADPVADFNRRKTVNVPPAGTDARGSGRTGGGAAGGLRSDRHDPDFLAEAKTLP